MCKSFITSVLLVACSTAAWCQGSSGPNGLPPGQTGVTTGTGGVSHVATPVSTFMAQCLTNLSGLASEKLRAQLLVDKAVTNQVRSVASIGQNELGSSCKKVCDDFAVVSNKISWARVSPGFLSEPEHTMQKIFGQMAPPPLPAKGELQLCLPQGVTANWCPPVGVGVGAGPTRLENPLDKIQVCISATDALKYMNFTAADAAHNCARPAIVDAAQRIQAEHQCVADVAMNEQKSAAAKAAAEKAAANGVAQLPVGAISMSPGARKKP